jgi:DNA-binding transcriptional LysR family regulator
VLGAGILQCPAYTVDAELASGCLAPILADYPVPETSVHAVHGQGSRPSAKLRGFIDLLAARLGRALKR